MCKEYFLNLDLSPTDCSQLLRSETSRIYTHKEHDYPVVYLPVTAFAKVTIRFKDVDKMTLIVNLQDYYVIGFLINEKCYAIKNLEDDLTNAGFSVEEVLPYGDPYYQIGQDGVEEKVCNEAVTMNSIISAIDFIVDMDNSQTDKRESLVRVFWSLVEGVRFSSISDVV